MPLTDREQVIVAVANALTSYAIGRSEDRIPTSATPHQFVLDAVPASMRSRVSAEMVDDIFVAILAANGS